MFPVAPPSGQTLHDSFLHCETEGTNDQDVCSLVIMSEHSYCEHSCVSEHVWTRSVASSCLIRCHLSGSVQSLVNDHSVRFSQGRLTLTLWEENTKQVRSGPQRARSGPQPAAPVCSEPLRSAASRSGPRRAAPVRSQPLWITCRC